MPPSARQPARGSQGDRWQAIACGKAAPTPQEITWLLAISSERDRAVHRSFAAWCEGYAAGEQAHDGDYSRGYTDGVHDRKHAYGDAADEIATQIRRWGAADREHFGDPQPSDYPGGMFPVPGPGRVWLAGPPVHRHECPRACYAYEPGWYTPARAADILAKLPGDFSQAVAHLRGMTAKRVAA